MDFLSAALSWCKHQVIPPSEQHQTCETLHTPQQSTQRQTLNTLPIELQERIVIAFMRDPDTTFDQVKALRLVCKSLDAICSRRVLTSIRLFGHDAKDVLGNFHNLNGVLSCNRLLPASTLVIPDWQWIYPHGSFLTFEDLPGAGGAMAVILLNTFIAPIFHFLRSVFSPKALPVGVFRSFIRLRALFRLASANEISFSNIRRVECSVLLKDPHSIQSLTVRWLLKFPQLTELVLKIDDDRILCHLSCYLSKFRNLRKLALTFIGRSGLGTHFGSVDEFGKAIARNSTLTHLELFPGNSGVELYRRAVASVFNHLQTDSPLNLQHLCVSEIFGDTPAIIPHIRSLKSVHQNVCPNPTIFSLLLRGQIFPPDITTECIDAQFIDYIMRHPGITHLSDHHDVLAPLGPCVMLNSLAQQHSQTLEYFCTFGKTLCAKLERTNNELSLLRCRRLRQLVLCYGEFYFPGDPVNTEHLPKMKAALSIFARLESLSVLVIGDLNVFKECIKYCRESSNPLIKDLVQRLVFEKYVVVTF